MNDRTAVFVGSFPVGKHTVTMILTRRRFLTGRITCRWSAPKPRKLTREEKHEYRSGRAAAVADAYGSKRGRIGARAACYSTSEAWRSAISTLSGAPAGTCNTVAL